MARPQGMPKTGGRKRGTPNRKSTELADQLASVGLNVPVELAKSLPDLEANVRVETLMELLTFLFPKRKAVEYSGQISTSAEPDHREETQEDRAERKRRIGEMTLSMFQLDDEFQMTVLRKIAEMNNSRTICDEGQKLLSSIEWKT